MGSRRAGSVVVAHGLSCSTACGIFPDQGSNPCPVHWQADSYPLRHQGSPHHCLFSAVLIGVATDFGWPSQRISCGFTPRRVTVGTFGQRWDSLVKILCNSTHGDLAGFSWIANLTGNSCISLWILNGSSMSMEIDIYIPWKFIAREWPFTRTSQ